MVRNSIYWRVPQVLSDTAIVLTKLGRLCELVLRSAETDCPLDSVGARIVSLVSGRRCVHLEARAGANGKIHALHLQRRRVLREWNLIMTSARGRAGRNLIRDRRGGARAVRPTIFSLTATYGQSIFEIP
jgi:hypothetical protein